MEGGREVEMEDGERGRVTEVREIIADIVRSPVYTRVLTRIQPGLTSVSPPPLPGL